MEETGLDKSANASEISLYPKIIELLSKIKDKSGSLKAIGMTDEEIKKIRKDEEDYDRSINEMVFATYEHLKRFEQSDYRELLGNGDNSHEQK